VFMNFPKKSLAFEIVCEIWGVPLPVGSMIAPRVHLASDGRRFCKREREFVAGLTIVHFLEVVNGSHTTSFVL